MNFKRANGSKKSIANMTENVIHSEMRFQMAIQNRFHPEVSIAVVALERLFASVGSYMPHQVASFFEIFVAVAAAVRKWNVI